MSFKNDDFPAIAELCQKSDFGKRLPNALYIHVSALERLDPLLQSYEGIARKLLSKIDAVTLIKFSTDTPKLSYLFYPDFDTDPHPALVSSMVVNLETNQVSDRDYSDSLNPPILHRKETFVSPDYPYYSDFVHLTNLEVSLGLLENSRSIGTRQQWEKRLAQKQITFEGHYLVCSLRQQNVPSIQVDRHRAAIPRKTLSRPVRLALEAGIFQSGMTFFDYGCGYGRDITEIAQLGHDSRGWDPFYAPRTDLIEADIVNLGYVINVIEDVKERREALVKAWGLTALVQPD